jgi:hypothetical protein
MGSLDGSACVTCGAETCGVSVGAVGAVSVAGSAVDARAVGVAVDAGFEPPQAALKNPSDTRIIRTGSMLGLDFISPPLKRYGQARDINPRWT